MANVYRTYELLIKFFTPKKYVYDHAEFKNRLKNTQPEFTTDEYVSYKALYLTDLTTPWFEGLNHGSYGLNSTFKCNYHNFPDLNCTCGFHSYKNYESALYESKLRFGTIVAQIDNYGDIIEHELGYRSEEQHIKKLYIVDSCSKIFCKENITNFSRNKNILTPRCNKHKGSETHELTELAIEYQLVANN